MHVILLLWCLFSLLLNPTMAQSATGISIGPARALDMMIQDYAYRAFILPRTGVPYDGTMPSNLTGIQISAMRLRTGSLRFRGIQSYKEFQIPKGIMEDSYVERLILVYQNLGNWSTKYYPLPGYTHLTPVLGLLAYDAANLSAMNLPELKIKATGNPILIHFGDTKPVPAGSSPKCVWINLNGWVNFSRPISGNTCSTVDQGHFSMVVESVSPAPGPASTSEGDGGASANPRPVIMGKSEGNKRKVWIIVGSVVGGIALLVLFASLILWAQKFNQRQKMQQMERAAEVGEALHLASIGNVKTPAAMVTRTRPVLETEYVT
ncbi:hypothetical protein SAY87_028107 [Trapa incisa]|uniref:Uncharacterized protein n=1 Tax=Trapa incisa TaxID=236973 RepID=A0AAN7QRB3_9MYRT|nr:hypothetical protein SAY87_028107 [Trapa incisa]